MKQFDLDECVVRLVDGVLQVVWAQGTEISKANASAVMIAVNVIAEGQRYPLLVELGAPRGLSRHARAAFAQPCSATRIALMGESPVDRMLAAYQLRTSPAPCPARYFNDRNEAMAWLRCTDPTN